MLDILYASLGSLNDYLHKPGQVPSPLSISFLIYYICPTDLIGLFLY